MSKYFKKLFVEKKHPLNLFIFNLILLKNGDKDPHGKNRSHLI